MIDKIAYFMVPEFYRAKIQKLKCESQEKSFFFFASGKQACGKGDARICAKHLWALSQRVKPVKMQAQKNS